MKPFSKCLAQAGDIIAVRPPYSFSERDFWRPSQVPELGYIEKLPWRSIGLRQVVSNFALVTDYILDEHGQLIDSDVFAGPDIDHARLVVEFHQETTGFCEVV